MTHDTLPKVSLPNGVTLTDEITVKLIWGGRAAGIEWLRRLPEILDECCARWHITLHPDVPELNYNLVLFGTTPEHGPVVIKTSPPHEEVLAEIEGLRASQGPGVVRLIDADPGVSIMLLERVTPGTMLRNLTDNGTMSDHAATTIAAAAMKTYWHQVPDSPDLIPLDRWFKALYAYRDKHPEGDGAIPGDLVTLAIRHADDLLSTEREKVTLHGDLHHQNILWDRAKGWTIIDPKGLIGERGYDSATWMRNPRGLETWPDVREVIDNRLDTFSALLQIDRFRLWQWTIVHAVLSVCWTMEEGNVEDVELHQNMIVGRILAKLPDASR